ncbi:MAG: DUF4936 family protein [Sulfuriferula multivorans]|uniref:DUF4936 family protein n=1 Tax=Sulfuriferula multivorans TaxID=1559896 RepID=A0A7C9NZ77_9PROT|nr:DUF4936 family protein [Sulfuriferula multivorans]
MKCAYVYYRIDPEQASLAATRINALLHAMATHCSQPPRQLARCDDPRTWMEIYEGIADLTTFAVALNVAVQTYNCTEFIHGERHLECFSANKLMYDA